MRLEVPDRPPTVVILHPYEHRTVVAGGVLRLNGLATGSDGEPVDPAKVHWLFDGRDIGTGYDVWTDAPPAGDHRVTLVAETGAGKAQASATFRTVAPPDWSRAGPLGHPDRRRPQKSPHQDFELNLRMREV